MSCLEELTRDPIRTFLALSSWSIVWRGSGGGIHRVPAVGRYWVVGLYTYIYIYFGGGSYLAGSELLGHAFFGSNDRFSIVSPTVVITVASRKG